MRLNNKGFAISSIMYLILIMAVLLILVTLSLLGNRKLVLDKLKDNIKGEIYTELAEEQFNRLYEQIDYIESTGTQWIDTGVVPTNTTGFKADIMTTAKVSDQIFFGSRTTTDTRAWVGKTSSIYYGWNTLEYTTFGSSDMYLNSIKLNYLNDRNFSINGSLIHSISSSLGSNTKSVYVFAGNDNGTAKYFSQIRIYNLQITQDSKVVRDLVPCYRKSDKTVGLYDKTSGVFYTNKGTGSFIPGPTSVFSEEYQEVDYIESTGTQWIDTEFKATEYTGIEAKFQFTSISPTQQALFGSGNAPGLIYNFYINGKSGWSYAYNNDSGNWVPLSINADTSQHQLIFNYTGDSTKELIFDSTKISLKYTSVSGTTTADNVYIASYKDAIALGAQHAKVKIFMFNMVDKGHVVRNYIPCYRKSDGVIGLYDTIDGKFYTNAGTGVFKKGRDIDNYFDANVIVPSLIGGSVNIVDSNKLTLSRDINQYYIQNKSSISLSSLNLIAGKKYLFTYNISSSYTSSSLITTVLFYDSSNKLIGEKNKVGIKSDDFIVDIPTNASYLRFRFNRTDHSSSSILEATYSDLRIIEYDG